jgi:hypothetical protein
MTQEGTGPLAGRQLTYWVAYSHSSGLGAVAASTAARLSTPGQLVGLAEQIGQDAGHRDVVILSWHLMSASTEAAVPTAVERVAPAEVGPVDVPVPAPQGAAVRAEIAAMAHALDAADRVGLSVVSTRCEPQRLPGGEDNKAAYLVALDRSPQRPGVGRQGDGRGRCAVAGRGWMRRGR